MGSPVVLLMAVIVVALAGLGIALGLFLILREIRALRLPKLRKPIVEYLTQATAAYTARLKDHAMSDEVLQGLHAVTAFAQHGVKEYDKSLKAGASGVPPGAPAPSVMDGMMSEPPIRVAPPLPVPGPPPDGTSSQP